MLPRPVAIGLTVLISLMWALNLVVGFIYPGRSDPYVNAIFAIVVGAIFALGRKDNGHAAAVRAARRKLAQAIEPTETPEETGEDDQP